MLIQRTIKTINTRELPTVCLALRQNQALSVRLGSAFCLNSVGKMSSATSSLGWREVQAMGSFSWLNNVGKDFNLLCFLLRPDWLTQGIGDTQRPEWRESRVLGESLWKKTMGRGKRHL